MKRAKLVTLLVGLCVIMLPLPVMAQATPPVATQVVEVMNPFAEWGEPASEPAPRLDTLNGKTIGLLNPVKSNTTFYLDYLEEALKERFPDIKFKYYAKQPCGDEAQMFREGPDRPKEFVWAKHWDEAVMVSLHYHNRSNVAAIAADGVDAVIHGPSM